MKTTIQGWFSSFSGIIVAVVTLLGITGVALASGGAMFNPGSLSNQSGPPLGGVASHSEIQQCSACHASPWETATMSDRCLECHSDITAQLEDPASLHSMVNIGETGLNCRNCHTEHHGPTASLTRIPPGWDPHDQLGFSLKAHRLRMDGTPFECQDCHLNGYNNPFDQETCANCHLQVDQIFTQEHILTFWTDCQACHDGLDTHGSKFDHNQVPFNLVGLHALTSCSKCHVDARNISDLQATTQECYDCHKEEDKHLGQFGTKCGVCHTAEGWGKSAQFDHDLANFKLRGKHTKVACENCHVNNVYKGTPSDCYSCHKQDDKHAGEFGVQCELCHVADGWNRAVDHSKFAFKLDGKHTTVACESCHINAVFIGTPMDCASCHKKDDAHAGRFGDQCGTCHTTENWTSATFDHNTVSFKLTAHQTKSNGTAFVCKDCHVKNYAAPFDQTVCANCHLNDNQVFASEHILTFWTNCMACHDGIDSHGTNFDHNRVPFNLIGKHAQVKCASCHINDRTIADMQATSQDCFTCHQKDDFHNGQFGTSCGSCHSPQAWKPALVDHSKFAFQLDGKHSTVACASCHINGVFKGTPMDCASCHTKDDAHKGQLGTNCAACHAPTGWKPANIDHSKFAFQLDGKHSTVACESCHINGVFKGTPMDCASCHTDDDAHKGQLGTNCAACHAPAGWKPANIDHSKFAFQLDGKHSAVACESCHINGVFKGTPMDCASCHTDDDAHKGQLGTNCAACHAPTGWKPANIDHSKFAFQLDGKHSTVACESCHINGVFKGTPMDCASCHTDDDAHKGQLGTNCAACHAPTGWKPANIDHSKFAFHLDGRHSAVACESCHINGVFKGTPMDCVSCHIKDDAHNGQLGTLCASCHAPDGWKPAMVDHSKFAFHLDGKHAAVNCTSCHVNGVFKGTPMDCASCHTDDDAHKGSLGNQCGTCHSPSGWSPATFDHNTVSFKLTAHQTKTDGSAFACKDCHVNGYAAPFDQSSCGNCHLQVNQAFATEHFLTFGTDCMACHDGIDSHGSNFDHDKVAFNLYGKHILAKCSACHANARTLADLKATPQDCFSCHEKDDEHNGQLGKDCSACHLPNGWKPATVDHSKFAFHLDGKHATVSCESCHKNGVFKGTPMDCASCHIDDDAHDGQLGTQCAACHSPNGWKPATVDHSKFAFHLDGKHSEVDCESCHKNGVFKGTPMDCASCHIDDDAHDGQLGTQCAACHSPNGWKPATVDHSKFAFHLDGKHAAAACTDCHKNNVFKGTPMDCASCHIEDDAHNGSLGTQCGTCHSPNGWSPATFDHNAVSFKLTAHQTKTDGSAFVCKDCHVNGYSSPFDQNTCGNCHLQIDQPFATEHFLAFGTNCMACHDGVESLGSNFDHNKVPFNLVGKHAAEKCSACHINAHTLSDLKAAPQDCFACHGMDDAHNGQLGTNCAACHTPNGWKPATVDHSKFAFHLDGKHATAACTSCHINGVFKGTPMDCASCHTKDDAHKGSLGNQCGTCHTPNGWSPASFDHNTVSFKLTAHQKKSDGSAFACKDCHVNGYAAPFDQNTCGNCHLQINQPFATEHFLTFGTNCMSCHDGVESLGSNFNHNAVPFKLSGKHAPVACSKCHVNARTVADLKATPQACISCHLQDDHHNGQFGTDCAACHSTDGWELAKIDHSKFAFKLDGKHATVACQNCHINGVFKGTPMDCASCHTDDDAHNGTLGNQCAVCHTPSGWKPSTFNHNNSAFQLTGKHQTVACESCHINGVFKGTPMDCASCHSDTDPHQGRLGTQCTECHTTNGWKPSTFDHANSSFQLTGKHTTAACAQCHKDMFFVGTPTACASCHGSVDPHSGALGAQCETCHTTAAWKPSTFNHANSSFKLTGKHTTVACGSCHKDMKFKGTPTTCFACHAANDHHGGKYGTNCAACHSTAGWKPATFDHNLSSFPLTGAHVSTACTKCHINGVFTGTPKECVACHSSKDVHAGKAGTNCATCHTTTAWKPSTLSHTFPLRHGNGTAASCATCHPSSLNAYTCYGCHEHTPTNIASEHKDVRNFSQDCVQCHADGRD